MCIEFDFLYIFKFIALNLNDLSQFISYSIQTKVMITFKHKSNAKQIKIKTKRELNDRMSPWLQDLFGMKNPIVGFKVANNKYYDAQTFYANKQKFYNQTVDIIEANDQLEISFVSDNLNSSTNIRNPAPHHHVQDFSEEIFQAFKIVNDIRTFQRQLQDKNELSILFSINQIFKKEVTESINIIKSQGSCKANFFIRMLPNKSNEQPSYGIYVGKKQIAMLNLTRQYKENIVMVLDRYIKKLNKGQNGKKQRHEEKQLLFKASFQHENQAPSFTTYQLQQRLNQDACQDYLNRMFQQKYLKKYEYLKLNEKCEQNFVQFYRIFCENVIDNDYQNFKNQILHKVQNNLQLLLSNVDEIMDLSRPISRQQQRKQNLKRSVSNIEIVKVENYFEILDQLKSLLMPMTVNQVKSQLLDQNQVIFKGFADYLSRKISKSELAHYLQRSVDKNQKRPVSRCLPRSANRNREPAHNSEDEIFAVPASNFKLISTNVENKNEEQIFQNQPQPAQKEQAKLIKLMGTGSGSGSKQNKNDNKEIPPMFGSSKQQNNFSPIKYMSDIESNYKQAWTRLESKANLFQPEQYGLLYYYLQTRDDSISNHIQQLEWNQQPSITKLKKFLEERMIQIMERQFQQYDLDMLATYRNSPQIDCIFQNFKYQSDLNKFLTALHTQLSIFTSRSPSPSPSPTYRPVSQRVQHQILTKKSSDSKLLDKKEKRSSLRKYSDQHLEIHSPKESSFSHAKTNQQSFMYLQILHRFWNDQFQQMIDHCNFTEEKRQQYLREAFKEGNPSVYSWINQFVQGRLKIIDSDQLKSSLKIKEQQNKYIMRVVPIFSQILRCFAQQGKISDKMRKWCVVELMQLNTSIIGAFEYYIKIKNADQFVDCITLAYEMQNSEMQYFRSYLKRLEYILKQMSAQDEVGMAIFNLYPKQIKAICEYYFISGNVEELLDSLDTLHKVQTKRRTIRVATLNFSGINLNPFEYFDGSQDFQKISDLMKQILLTETQKLDCNLHIIDKLFTTNKMSVRFGQEVCDGQKLVGLPQFAKKWRAYYDTNKPLTILEATEDTIQSCMLFDYYCYLSLVRFLYDADWKVSDYVGDQFRRINKKYQIQGIQTFQSQKLKQYLQTKRNRTASKIQKKYQMAMEYFMKNNLDIFCLQQAGQPAWQEELVHDYGWVKGKDSVILYRKDKFGQSKTSMVEKFKDKLDFNHDTAFFFGDRGYLILSIHLRSNPEQHLLQAQQIFKALQQIYDEHPLIKIIVGIDANHFIGGSEFNFLNFVPMTPQQVTSNKMRTSMQVQFKKAGAPSKCAKDFILTNLQIKEYSIQKINGTKADPNDLLPTDEHPYDHFVVNALI